MQQGYGNHSKTQKLNSTEKTDLKSSLKQASTRHNSKTLFIYCLQLKVTNINKIKNMFKQHFKHEKHVEETVLARAQGRI